MPRLRETIERPAPTRGDENRRKRAELSLQCETALKAYMAELVRQPMTPLKQGPSDVGELFELSTTIAQVGAATRVLRIPTRD
jgi:hypothetical protein